MLPTEKTSSIAELEHQGFSGRELEATERFFSVFGLEQPGIPLLALEFTNPLFLKLYCEGLKGMGLSSPPAGEATCQRRFPALLGVEGRRHDETAETRPGGSIRLQCD